MPDTRSPDAGAGAVTTEAGRRLPAEIRASRNPEEMGTAIANAIRAIEAEAVAAERARIRAEVEGLPDVNPTPTLHTGTSTDWPMVRRAAVLALLEPTR